MRRVALSAVCASLVAVSAPAAVVTFKDLDADPRFVYNEAGVRVTGNEEIGAFGRPQTAHMDDSGTSFSSRLRFETGGLFDAVSFDLFPIFPTQFCPLTGCDGTSPIFDNMLVRGFRNGTEVARTAFFMGVAPNTFTFDDTFLRIDSLMISLVFPSPTSTVGECVDVPCTHLDIDNVVLRPVPLPASLSLLGAALLAAGGLGLSARPSGRVG